MSFASAVKKFRPGVWRHYKGAHYLAFSLARNDETEEPMVVYTRLYARGGMPMTVRRLAMWSEKVTIRRGGKSIKVPRFEFVGNMQPEKT